MRTNRSHSRRIQDGAQDYIEKSSCNGELLPRPSSAPCCGMAIAGATAGGESGTDRTRVIGVIGAKGGVGATTGGLQIWRWNCAVQTEQKVLLADLDVNGGAVPPPDCRPPWWRPHRL